MVTIIFDPFSQVVEPTIQTSTIITDNAIVDTSTCSLEYSTTKLIFGLDEKMVIGIVMGMLILNFVQYMTEK